MEPKKIPTLLGLFIVALLVGAVIYFGERVPAISNLFAKGGTTAQNIELTNVSDTSLSVSWMTSTSAVGDVVVTGGATGSRTVLDDRDTPTQKIAYVAHHVTIRDLTPDTIYQVTLRSNGRNIESKPITAATFPTLSPSQSSLGPAFGSVVSQQNQPAVNSIVFVTPEGGQKLSTLVTSSGAWLIALNRARTLDGTDYLPLAERHTLEILVHDGSSEETSAITDTLNDSPVPLMTLGKSYDFRRQQARGAGQPLAQTILGDSTSSKPTVALIAPANGAAIPSTTPLIHGTGISGKTVVLTLGINNPYSDTTIVTSDGTWRYTPKKPLAIGKQSVTMSTADASGKTIATTHTFEILKSGTRVLGEATPSATLTPTIEETPTPESTLAGEPIPTSGTLLPTLIVIFAGLGLLIAGGTLLVL